MRSSVLQKIGDAVLFDMVDEPYLNVKGFDQILLKGLKGLRLAVSQPRTVASSENSVHA